MNNTERIPQAPDAELATLGGLLLDGSIPKSTRAQLQPPQFFVKSNRQMYEALLALDERGVRLDPVVLTEELRRMGVLDDVGGGAYVATLTDRAIRGDLDTHVNLVIEAAERRQFWTVLHEGLRTVNDGKPLAQAVEIVRPAVEEASHSTDAKADEPARLATSWADFDAEEFPQGERIAFAVERGEIALLNALPNAGKTTLALNVALCLAAGREFPPLVTGRKPRRVLYVDGETTRRRLQRDLRVMTRGFSREEVMTAGENLHVICEAEIKGEPLALTRADHLLALSAEALSIQPDFIAVDTLAALCPVVSENDNAEQSRKVWRPLQKLARDCDAAMLVNHHVGKRSEDSQTPERVYRGRGASASGGAARAVWLLIPDASTPGVVRLACVKAKGDTPAETTLQHNPKTRWMDSCQAAPPPLSAYQQVLTKFNGRALKTKEIKSMLPELSGHAVEDALKAAVEAKDLFQPSRGVYQKPAQKPDSTFSTSPIGSVENVESTQPVDGVEDGLDFGDWDENGDCGIVDGDDGLRNHPDWEDGE